MDFDGDVDVDRARGRAARLPAPVNVQVDDLRRAPQCTYVLARRDDISRDLLAEHGYAPVTDLPPGADEGRLFYAPAR